jgi:hypothetical protein
MKEIVITGEYFNHFPHRLPVVKRKNNEILNYYCLNDNTQIKFKKRDWQKKKLTPYKGKCIIEYMLNNNE